MVEAEAVVALEERAVRSEKLLSRQGEEHAAEPVRAVRRQELGDRAAVEQSSLDRSALQHAALDRLEAVDACGEERVNASRARSRLPRRGRRRASRASARRTAGCPRLRRRCGRGAPERRRSSCSSPSISSSDSVSLSGESETSVVRGRGAAQEGRESKRSGRARQRSRIGAPLEKPSTYSSRSSSVGSAQWMSSTTTTRGRASASVSNSRRNAHAVSSGEPGSSFAPIAPMISRVATGPRSTFARSAVSFGSGSAPAISRTISASGR